MTDETTQKKQQQADKEIGGGFLSRFVTIGPNGLALTRSAGVLSVRVGGAAANFFTVVLLTRLLPPEGVGLVLSMIAMSFMFSVLLTLNLENVAIRFLQQPLERDALPEAATFVRYSMKVSGVMMVLILPLYGVIILALHPDLAAHWGAIILAALSIPLLAFLRIGSRYGQAFHKVFVAVLAWGFFRPVLLLAGLGFLLLGNVAVSITTILGVFVIAAFLASLVQALLLSPHMKFMRAASMKQAPRREWTRAGLYLAATVFLLDYFQNSVLVAAAPVLSDEAIGQLGVVLRIVGVMGIGQMAINMATGQQVSRHHARGEIPAMCKALFFANHMRFWPTLILSIIVALMAKPILSVFGADYIGAAKALRILVLVPVIGCFWGNAILLLNIHGANKAIVAPSLVATLVLFIILPWAGRFYGLDGVAWAAIAILFGFHYWLYLRARRETGVRAAIPDLLVPARKIHPPIKSKDS